MVRSVYSILLAAMVAVPGISSAAVIQPVGYNNCGEASCGDCTDGCNDSNNCNKRSRRSKNANCDACDACETGRQRCGMRSTWRDFGTNWTGRCGPVGRAARLGIPGAKCLKWCMDTKGSGDSGWSPPARMPVNRTHTGFASYSSYGGNGGAHGGAPMVYQPTDTAQLGYTYAHVPTWRPNPNMIPATPYPSNFHTRFCPASYGGSHMNTGCMPMGGGMIIDGEMIGGDYCPSCVSTPVPRSSTEAVVHLSQARKPNSTVAVSTTPVRVPASKVENPIRLTAQSAPPAPTPQPQVAQPKMQVTPPQVQVPQHQMRVQLPQLPPQQWQQPQMETPRQNTNQQRPQQKKSGGWFGLPSLGDVKF